jgi:hypothetical protein
MLGTHDISNINAEALNEFYSMESARFLSDYLYQKDCMVILYGIRKHIL